MFYLGLFELFQAFCCCSFIIVMGIPEKEELAMGNIGSVSSLHELSMWTKGSSVKVGLINMAGHGKFYCTSRSMGAGR